MRGNFRFHRMLYTRLFTPRAAFPLPPPMPGALLPNGAAPCASREDYRQLLAGTEAVLARWTRRVHEREFPATVKACRAMRLRVTLGVELKLPPALLMDVAHEIAQYADVATRAAARRCLARAVHQRASRKLP